MRNFKTLKVWQLGQKVATKVCRLTSTMTGQEQFVFASQLARAAILIPSNIAEGNSRQSRKEYARFIEIALGSAFELETQLLVLKSIEFASEDTVTNLIEEVEEERRMLSGLLKSLRIPLAPSS